MDTSASGTQAEEYDAKQVLNMLKITDLDARVRTLSGGQKKRVALAGVLISHPGPLACAAVESACQIFGEVKNIAAFSLDISDNPGSYSEAFMEAFHAFPAGCLFWSTCFAERPATGWHSPPNTPVPRLCADRTKPANAYRRNLVPHGGDAGEERCWKRWRAAPTKASSILRQRGGLRGSYQGMVYWI